MDTTHKMSGWTFAGMFFALLASILIPLIWGIKKGKAVSTIGISTFIGAALGGVLMFGIYGFSKHRSMPSSMEEEKGIAAADLIPDDPGRDDDDS